MSIKSLMVAILVIPTLSLASPFPAGVMNYDSNDNPIPNEANDGTPDVYQAINRVCGTGYESNEAVMGLFTEPDYLWETVDSDAEIVLIGMTAGYTNTIGYYQENGSNIDNVSLLTAGDHFGWLDDGTETDPYSNVASIDLPIGSEFGWYMDVNIANHGDASINPQITYYSDPDLNGEVYINESLQEPAGIDHMMTFNLDEATGKTIWVDGDNSARQLTLQSAYLLCWEDLYQNHPDWADYDYDDMMYVVAQVTPTNVPEPTLLSLLGISLFSIALIRRKKK